MITIKDIYRKNYATEVKLSQRTIGTWPHLRVYLLNVVMCTDSSGT